MKRFLVIFVFVFLTFLFPYAVLAADLEVEIPAGELPVKEFPSGGVYFTDEQFQLLLDALVPQSLTEIEPMSEPLYSGMLQSGFFFDCNTTQLGNITVFIPGTYQTRTFTLTDSGDLFNIGSATVSGILYRGTTMYYFRCTSFATPEYRTSSTGTWQVLTVRSIGESNVQISSDFEDFNIYPASDFIQFLSLILLGVIAICQVLKLFFSR